MGKWIDTGAQDAVFIEIKKATQWHVIKAYSQGDSYATVIGNSIGYASMAPSDYAISGATNALRTLTFPAGKSFTATADSGLSPDLNFAFVDAANSRVIYVTGETTDVAISVGSTVYLPSDLTYTVSRTPS